MPSRDVVSWNSIIAFFSQKGKLEEAKDLFHLMPEPNTAAWNVMIQAHAQSGHLDVAKGLFDQMPSRDFISWTTLMNSYADMSNLDGCQEVFDNLPEISLMAGTIMMQAFAAKGHVSHVKSLFDSMLERDSVLWNVFIAAFSSSTGFQVAKTAFDIMPHRSVASWNSMIQAYASGGHFDHAKALFQTMPHRDLFTWNAMIQLFSSKGLLEEAKVLFTVSPQRDIVSWNTLLQALTHNASLASVKLAFQRMPSHNQISLNVMIQAHAVNGSLEDARQAFDKIHHRDPVSSSSMIAAYSQSGRVDDARAVLEDTISHAFAQGAVVSWNAMISGYARNGHTKLAMDVFRLMDLHGVSPDSVTYIAIFDACSRIANAEEGSAFIASIVHPGILQDSVAVGNAALTMYGRSGLAAGAWSVFQQMPVRDSVSWNAMLTAFARNGHGEAALDVFLAMELEGLVPDIITFVNVLSACSHAGLLHRARGYFHSISCDYGLTPIYDHYVCLTDLLARSGRLVEAEELVNSMPFEPNYEAWMALLGACRSHGDVRRGNRAAGFFVQAGVDAESPYVLLSHLYAEAGSKDDVLVIRKAMRRKTKLDQSPVILGGLYR
ncbi:pentatricopeptide repeat-containing protein At4g02750-like [Selaginella moellendorffii]|uniref:pentatricopeptide repeat-containing protein At4g02750-like n=1 Tax=Selaginella moellendorffii TaxID=88036 RepID=UPI000D1CA6F2|nr:pentatricopeptide repeat-containing protein At4g02750-like [Selaginella moellendorffii]|eukprot:XP_024532121.1 pentatricopeptide repeat-containing protein At4g02750-like [Selaginella moellendorffii]